MSQAITTEVTPRELIERSVAGNTRKAYAWAMHILDSWLHEHGYQLNDTSLSLYLTHLFNQGKSPATAGLIITAVRFSGRMAGVGEPIVGPLTEQILSAYRKELSHVGRGQAKGIQWEEADKIVKEASTDGLAGLRDAAVIAIMSDAMLRISEVAALRYEDIDLLRKEGTGLVHIRRSKTDQEGAGATLFLGFPTVRAVRNWIQAGKIKDGFLFRKVYRDVVKDTGLHRRTIARIIKKRAAEAGIKKNVSGHSLRVGSAQSLAHAGASLVEMQIAGRWKSSGMPAQYAKGEIATRGAVARFRYR